MASRATDVCRACRCNKRFFVFSRDLFVYDECSEYRERRVKCQAVIVSHINSIPRVNERENKAGAMGWQAGGASSAGE